MHGLGYTFALFITLLAAAHATLDCYICDTAATNNEDPQICDDTFTASRGATIESGCAACTKEKTIHSGIMFIKRGCEKSLRWESSVWTCNQEEREYVFGLPGTRCACLNNLCNGSNTLTNSLYIILISSIATYLLL